MRRSSLGLNLPILLEDLDSPSPVDAGIEESSLSYLIDSHVIELTLDELVEELGLSLLGE